MLDDMQDMLFSATRRKSVWVESSAILFLEEEEEEERNTTLLEKKSVIRSKLRLQLEQIRQSVFLPEQAQKLTQGQFKGNQELGFVQQRESLLADVALNDYLEARTHLAVSLHTQTQPRTHARGISSLNRCRAFETYRKFIGKL